MKPWDDAEAGLDEVSQLVHLSNLIGSDSRLVQPGGGNTSVKLEVEDLFGRQVRTLVVKGSGTDLRTITAAGFTHLYMDRLATLNERQEMSDEEMMALMRACMLFADRDPVPSVETPLHSLLPFTFVAHTHDVATLSLSDTPSAREHAGHAFGEDAVFLEYVRPGFPLAKRLAERFAKGLPPRAKALVMEKHGLAAWGETARECYESLSATITRAEEYAAERAGDRRVFGAPVAPGHDITTRRHRAAVILPVLRGELVRSGYPCVLHFDDSPDTLEAISGERFADVSARGVMTPEHILRAGVRPLVLPPDADAAGVRDALAGHRREYVAYATQHDHAEPIPDYLKTIVMPGLGIAFAGKDRRNALVAAECYRATLQVMAAAEAIEGFRFLDDADACEMEYWPLERRKIEEGARTRKPLDGKVAVIVGAASGIGRATALRFAEVGAHLLLADLDATAANALAGEINARTPEHASSMVLDVTDSEAVANAMDEAVIRFGGIDVIFYTPGVAPALYPVADLDDAEVRRQLAVHYEGAVAATKAASRVMLAQGTGGRLIYNASKAAYAPGEGAAAYGASKAALVHYVRNVANELSRHEITANYINADAVDTPLFRRLVAQRAAERGESENATLARYAERSIFRTATVPPEAVADAALWLASDESRFTSGCVISVGGGAEGMPR